MCQVQVGFARGLSFRPLVSPLVAPLVSRLLLGGSDLDTLCLLTCLPTRQVSLHSFQ